jgi:hypothetical protein
MILAKVKHQLLKINVNLFILLDEPNNSSNFKFDYYYFIIIMVR